MQPAPAAPPTTAPPGSQEIEWQLDALDLRPVETWLLSGHGGLGLFVVPGPIDDLVDTYCDTADWRFQRAGYALRLRRRAEQVTATLKTLSGAENGVRHRLELSEPLAGDGLEALAQAAGPVGERGRLLAGRAPIQVLFEIHTRRRRYAVMVDGAEAAEVALDDTAVPVGDEAEPFRLRRVEVELSESSLGSLATLQPFVDRMREACGLQTAILSKYDLGLFARGLQPGGVPDLGPQAVEAAQSLGQTAFATLRRHFAAFLANEPGTRLGDDPEELHDMRVAARRLRAAMRLFANALPARVLRLREKLSWIAGALGEVRDLDVQLDQIHAWSAEAEPDDREPLSALVNRMVERRAAARRRMIRALDSVRYGRLAASFTTLLQRGPSRRPPEANVPVLEAAPPLITRRYQKARKLGDRINAASAPEAYHALRIECKKLRYALEFFRDLYGKPAEELIGRLVRLQDLLGQHQDACIAAASLRDLSRQLARRLPPQTVFVMGGIAERYAQQAAALRAQFPETFEQFKGRSWRRMHRAMLARPASQAKRVRPKSPSPPE